MKTAIQMMEITKNEDKLRIFIEYNSKQSLKSMKDLENELKIPYTYAIFIGSS
jgi:hypothetical protein